MFEILNAAPRMFGKGLRGVFSFVLKRKGGEIYAGSVLKKRGTPGNVKLSRVENTPRNASKLIIRLDLIEG